MCTVFILGDKKTEGRRSVWTRRSRVTHCNPLVISIPTSPVSEPLLETKEGTQGGGVG